MYTNCQYEILTISIKLKYLNVINNVRNEFSFLTLFGYKGIISSEHTTCLATQEWAGSHLPPAAEFPTHDELSTFNWSILLLASVELQVVVA